MLPFILLFQEAFLLSMLFSTSFAAFGDPYDYGRDETFRYMGDATIDEFNITDGKFNHRPIHIEKVVQRNIGTIMTNVCGNVFKLDEDTKCKCKLLLLRMSSYYLKRLANV